MAVISQGEWGVKVLTRHDTRNTTMSAKNLSGTGSELRPPLPLHVALAKGFNLLRRIVESAALGAVVVIGTQGGLHGAEFSNLAFEDAVITFAQPGEPYVLASDALGPWTTNGLSPDTISYNWPCLGFGCLSIHDAHSTAPAIVLQGNYSVLLQGPVNIGFPEPEVVPLFISQVGTVPRNATKFTMLVLSAGSGLFEVSFDNGNVGASLDLLTPLRFGETVRLVYDVSGFSGETGELRISAGVAGDISSETFLSADDLHFVPEPSVAALFAIGGCLSIYCGRELVGSTRPPRC